LGEVRRAIGLHPSQQGTLAVIGGHFAVLDWVSQPEVFAALHAPLVEGYALDAMEAVDAPAPSREHAAAVVERVLAAPGSEADAVGFGTDLRFAGVGVAGCALVANGELVQLTAFPEEGEPESATTIRRPSRRRAT
jgi:hypothetical protein